MTITETAILKILGVPLLHCNYISYSWVTVYIFMCVHQVMQIVINE